MIRKAGQCFDQRVNEFRTQPYRWPVLQDADINLVTDDTKMSIKTGADIYVGGQYFHKTATCVWWRSRHSTAGRCFPPNEFSLIQCGFARFDIKMGAFGKHVKLEADQGYGFRPADITHR